MSGLVFACIAPHGSMIIPLLNEEGDQQALVTRAAMEELGRRMAAAQPELHRHKFLRHGSKGGQMT